MKILIALVAVAVVAGCGNSEGSPSGEDSMQGVFKESAKGGPAPIKGRNEIGTKTQADEKAKSTG